MIVTGPSMCRIANAVPLLLLLLAVPIVGCKDTAAESASAEKESGEQAGSVTVRTEPAQQRAMAQWIEGLGSCEALPEKIATLTPAIGGQVLKILVEQGRSVQADEAIVEFDPALARANLDEKTAARDALEAAVEKAAATVERLSPLRQRGEIPQQQLFEAELALRQAKLQQQTANAAIASVQTELKLHTIRAPITGALDSLSCRLGQTLAAGSAIGEIVDARQLYVVVWLPAADARSVRVGQPARINPSDFRNSAASGNQPDHEVLAGQVKFVGQIVDPQTGNLPVRVLVDNAAARLAVGQAAAVSIRISQRADVLAVPVQAIEDLGEGAVLNVIREGKSSVLHPQLGVKDNDWIEITGTELKPGELVIVEGGYNLPEGTKVTLRPAAESGTESETASDTAGKAASKAASAGEAPSGAAP